MHASTPLEVMDLSDRRDARTFARSMLLTGTPASPEAHRLVANVVDQVIAPHRAVQGQLRPTMLPKYREALAPFLTDLLVASAAGKWSKLETNTNALHGHPGGSTAFKVMREAMRSAGLLEELPGYKRTYPMFGVEQSRSSRTSFRPTAQLLLLAKGHGVAPENLGEHFRPSKAAVPEGFAVIEARATKKDRNDKPRLLPVNLEDPKAAAIIRDMERLNAFLMEDGRIEGIVFAGLRRVFTNADQPDFDWQWHGRFYSIPGADAYEHMEGGSEARARAIRMDGEEVAEIDVSASQLTILHGLLGLPFDPTADPYALPGVSRDEVKRWITWALGASDPAIGGRKADKARAAGLARYPFLARLPELGFNTNVLSFHEAEVMRLTMENLMAQDIGFLPVHDAIMIPASKRNEAVGAMQGAFRRHFTDHVRTSGVLEPRIV